MSGQDLAGVIAILIPVFAILSGATIAISVIVTRYKLRVEQIKADALIRSEEIRAKNQLEIEKLFLEDKTKAKTTQIGYDVQDPSVTGRSSRHMERY